MQDTKQDSTVYSSRMLNQTSGRVPSNEVHPDTYNQILASLKQNNSNDMLDQTRMLHETSGRVPVNPFPPESFPKKESEDISKVPLRMIHETFGRVKLPQKVITEDKNTDDSACKCNIS